MLGLIPSNNQVIVCVLLVLAVAGTYAQVARYDFSTFDDPSYVFQNPHVRTGLTWRNVGWAFTAAHSGNWHPLTWLSHALDCQLFGVNPGWHHLTSVAIHALNAVLLFLLLTRMTGAVWRSAFVAGLFALHPLNVESVAWIAERKNVLSTLFWVLTMWAYVAYARRPCPVRYVLVVLVFALGLMAKPMLVTLPIVLLLMDWWPLGRYVKREMAPYPWPLSLRARGVKTPHPRCGPTGQRRSPLLEGEEARGALLTPVSAFLEKLPLFVLVIASCIITLHVQSEGGMTRPLEQYPVGERLANASVAYVAYLHKMLWPAGLCTLYPHPHDTLPVWQVVGSAVLLTVVTLLALISARRRSYLGVGWLWYLVTMVPVIGLVQVGRQAMADRYAYVPLIGVFIMVAWGAPELVWKSRASKMGRVVLIAPAAAVLIAFAVCAWTQAHYWKDADTCFGRAISVTHGSPVVWQCKAGALEDRGDTTKALAVLRQAIRESGDNADTRILLGMLYSRHGMPEAAADEFRAALRLAPRVANTHNNLGVALARTGRLGEARRQLEEAVHLDPRYSEAHHNLGVVLSDLGDRSAAVRHWRLAIELDPRRTPSRLRLGMALLKDGKPDEALGQLREAVRREPESGETHYRLAIGLYAIGDFGGAWQEVRRARELGRQPDPRFTDELSRRMPEPR